MSTTVNRDYDTPATGSEVGVWGTSLNTNFTKIDTNLGGLTSVALTNVNVTLNAAQYGCGVVRLTGLLTGTVIVTFPAVQGWWTIDNQTTGNFAAKISMGSGNVIAVEQGSAQDILIDGTNVKFRNLPPVGTYLDLGVSAVPAWITACTVPPYLNCDGSAFSAVTYPTLAQRLGSLTLPDFRGRSRSYLDQGVGRITTAGSGINAVVLGASGGAQNITLTTALIPSHSHGGITSNNNADHTHTYAAAGSAIGGVSGGGAAIQSGGTQSTSGVSAPHAHTISAEGGGGAHNNMPPTCIGGLTLIRAA